MRVEVLENGTGYPGLVAELARELVRQFQADGTVVPASRYGDSALRGAIVSVRRSVLQEDEFDDVVTGQFAIVAVIAFEDLVEGKPLLAAERVTSTDVRGSEGVYRLGIGETESDARRRAVRALAQNIVRRVGEVW